MKNLKKINVQELSFIEVKRINGGNPFTLVRLAVSAFMIIDRTAREGEKFYGNNADNPLSGAKL